MTKDIYVHLRPLEQDEVVATTKNAADNVNIDFDAHGNPVGVEVLGASGVDFDGFTKWQDLNPPIDQSKHNPRCRQYGKRAEDCNCNK